MVEKNYNMVMSWLAGHKKKALHERRAFSQVGEPHLPYPGMEEPYAKAVRECEIIDLIIGELTPPPPAKLSRWARALDFLGDALGLAVLGWAALGLGALAALGVILAAVGLHTTPTVLTITVTVSALGVTIWRRRKKGRK